MRGQNHHTFDFFPKSRHGRGREHDHGRPQGHEHGRDNCHPKPSCEPRRSRHGHC